MVKFLYADAVRRLGIVSRRPAAASALDASRSRLWHLDVGNLCVGWKWIVLEFLLSSLDLCEYVLNSYIDVGYVGEI